MKKGKLDKDEFRKKRRERLLCALVVAIPIFVIFIASPNMLLVEPILGCCKAIGVILAFLPSQDNEPPFIP